MKQSFTTPSQSNTDCTQQSPQMVEKSGHENVKKFSPQQPNSESQHKNVSSEQLVQSNEARLVQSPPTKLAHQHSLEKMKIRQNDSNVDMLLDKNFQAS